MSFLFASRMTQGIFVGHHDPTGAVMCITKHGVVRGKSWTRQIPSDAWESTNWEGLCGTPWQMVAPELKLTKKVTAHKKRAGPHCQELLLKFRQKLNPEDSTSCLRTFEPHGHTGGCQGCAVLVSQGKATKPHNDECRERIRTIIENLDGKSKDECVQRQNR